MNSVEWQVKILGILLKHGMDVRIRFLRYKTRILGVRCSCGEWCCMVEREKPAEAHKRHVAGVIAEYVTEAARRE